MINLIMISVASLLLVIAVVVPIMMVTGLIHSLRGKRHAELERARQ